MTALGGTTTTQLPAGRTRRLAEWQGRFLLSLYPPFVFMRIRCTRIGPGFRTARIRVAKSLLTRNLNGTTFGGTIFSAADPVYPLLYWQIFAHEGVPVRVWLRRGAADYRKPASTPLTLDFHVPDEELAECRAALASEGRWRHTHRTEARDLKGDLCAVLETQLYVSLPKPTERGVSGF